MQEIYICLDDSGKLTNKEKVSVYAGLVFLSKKEKDKFITQYRSIIIDVKCNYCNLKTCNKKCPEIKNTNIKVKDKRRLMNYIKKYFKVALIIQNDKVYNYIKESKAGKGRFIDYSLRRLIKEIVKTLIDKKFINPNLPLRLIINIDQQSTKSNGYYNLHDGLVEELKYGISNYNYMGKISPIINDDLEIILSYQDSGKNYVVQAADIIAGTVRKNALDIIENKNNLYSSLDKIVDFKIILP